MEFLEVRSLPNGSIFGHVNLVFSRSANVHMREQEKRKTGQLGLSKATKNGAVDYEHGTSKGGSSQLCTKATIPSKKVIFYTYKCHTCS